MATSLPPIRHSDRATVDQTDVQAVSDGMAPMLAIYGLWIAFAAECVFALIALRAPLESVVAALFSYRNRFQIEQRFRFEASYLLAEILLGGAFFALAIVAEHLFRTTTAWAYTYQRPFYPELLRRFARMAIIPAGTVLIGLAADQLVLRLS